MRRRGILVPAILAALLGAPPTVFGVVNQLSVGAATPTSGTTATVFRLSVEYDGRFPAVAVEARS